MFPLTVLDASQGKPKSRSWTAFSSSSFLASYCLTGNTHSGWQGAQPATGCWSPPCSNQIPNDMPWGWFWGVYPRQPLNGFSTLPEC